MTLPLNTLIAALTSFCGQDVTLSGWLQGRRGGGGVLFLMLRDGTGVCQCVVEGSNAAATAAAEALSLESAIRVQGLARSESRAPGGVELAVATLAIIGAAESDYPISRKAHGVDFLMSHRHLWLRSGRQTLLLRLRHTLISAARAYLDGLGFTLVDTPILVPAAGEDDQTLFAVDYFGRPMYLAQTGQLYLEAACMALRNVYCFGPTFRAEKSKTRRHLTEFWMLEPEMAFADLEAVRDLAEGLVTAMVGAVLERHATDLRELGRDVEVLRRAIRRPFPRMTYTEAVERLRDPDLRERLTAELEVARQQLLEARSRLESLRQAQAATAQQRRKDRMQPEIDQCRDALQEMEEWLATRPQHIESAAQFTWGNDLGGSDETILAGLYEQPLFITHYPVAAKAFYMKTAPDHRTVLNLDLLAPEGYGEIIGGSQREDDLARLTQRMREQRLDPESYQWYLDLRRYGSVPHGGFGMGIERMLCWIAGLKHVREAIPFPRLLGRAHP